MLPNAAPHRGGGGVEMVQEEGHLKPFGAYHVILKYRLNTRELIRSNLDSTVWFEVFTELYSPPKSASTDSLQRYWVPWQ